MGDYLSYYMELAQRDREAALAELYADEAYRAEMFARMGGWDSFYDHITELHTFGRLPQPVYYTTNLFGRIVRTVPIVHTVPVVVAPYDPVQYIAYEPGHSGAPGQHPRVQEIGGNQSGASGREGGTSKKMPGNFSQSKAEDPASWTFKGQQAPASRGSFIGAPSTSKPNPQVNQQEPRGILKHETKAPDIASTFKTTYSVAPKSTAGKGVNFADSKGGNFGGGSSFASKSVVSRSSAGAAAAKSRGSYVSPKSSGLSNVSTSAAQSYGGGDPSGYPFGDKRMPPEDVPITTVVSLRGQGPNHAGETFHYHLVRKNPAPGMQELYNKAMAKANDGMRATGLNDDAAKKAKVQQYIQTGALELLSDGMRGQLYWLKVESEHVLGAALTMGVVNGRRWELVGVGVNESRGCYVLLAIPA